MNTDERDYYMDKLDATAARIAEDFDACTIMVTRHIDGLTETYTVGRGNLHARVGMAQSWLEQIMNNQLQPPTP